MVGVKLTHGVGKNILTWGLGSIGKVVYQAIRELIRMTSKITKRISMISNN